MSHQECNASQCNACNASQHLRWSQHLSTHDVIRGKIIISANYVLRDKEIFQWGFSTCRFSSCPMMRTLRDWGWLDMRVRSVIRSWRGDDTWPVLITCYWYDGHTRLHRVFTMASVSGWHHTEPQSGTTYMNIEGIRYINTLFIDKLILFIEVRWSKVRIVDWILAHPSSTVSNLFP